LNDTSEAWQTDRLNESKLTTAAAAGYCSLGNGRFFSSVDQPAEMINKTTCLRKSRFTFIHLSKTVHFKAKIAIEY